MISTRPHLLCPIDFSEPSRAALGWATAIADHFGATLDIVAVDDPLLTEVASSGGLNLADETLSELRRFCGHVLDPRDGKAAETVFHVRTGKPAAEIVGLATELHADLIVMGSHGRTGVGKLFFGSTTERVLRNTTTAVLVTPGAQDDGRPFAERAQTIRHVLAPVDLSPASVHQVAVAGGIASALGASLLVAHAIEPVFIPLTLRAVAGNVEGQRRAEIEAALTRLVGDVKGCQVETIVVSGDVAREIVSLAEVRQAQIIVIGLRSGATLGPHMGSVTYRVLCLTHSLVLALPPR